MVTAFVRPCAFFTPFIATLLHCAHKPIIKRCYAEPSARGNRAVSGNAQGQGNGWQDNN